MELKHLITAGGAGASHVVHPQGRPLLDARLDTLLHLTTSEAVLAQVMSHCALYFRAAFVWFRLVSRFVCCWCWCWIAVKERTILDCMSCVSNVLPGTSGSRGRSSSVYGFVIRRRSRMVAA
jgi:hypothetical protein